MRKLFNHRTPNTTTLWSIVESMQRKLERQGMDAETIDAVITRGIAAIVNRGRGELSLAEA